MSLWLSKSLANGWRYGYGEYKKTLAQLSTAVTAYKTVLSNLPTWMQNVIGLAQQLGEQALAAQIAKVSQYTSLPTYYIWAESPSGEKLIGGEWNMLTGGAKAMQAYFSQFDAQMQQLGGGSSASDAWFDEESSGNLLDGPIRLAVIASTAAPKYYTPTTAADLAAVKEDVSGGSYILPLAIAAGVLLLIFLKKR